MNKILIEEATVKQVLEYVESVPDDRYAVEHIDRDTLVTDLREALASEAKEQPAQRSEASTWVNATTWRGLTDEDRAQCVQATVESGEALQLMSCIEAKLKAKNFA